MKNLRGERGIVVDFMVKVLLGLAIFGTILFDTGSILVNRFSASSSAQDIAVGVTSAMAFGHVETQEVAEREALELAEEFGVKLTRVELDLQGVVHIEVRRKATTIVAGRIGPLKDLTRASGSATASIRP